MKPVNDNDDKIKCNLPWEERVVPVFCICDDWKTYSSVGITGKAFIYCPWCGNELKEKTMEVIE